MQLKLSQRASLQVPTDLNALVDVLSWFDQFQNALLPYDVWLQCQLAIAEAFTNAVRHAHCNKSPETLVELEVSIHSTLLEIRVWDEGPGFDMDTFLQTQPLTVDENAEGGRGLSLIHQIADDLKYFQNTNQRNCLYMAKRFS